MSVFVDVDDHKVQVLSTGALIWEHDTKGPFLSASRSHGTW